MSQRRAFTNPTASAREQASDDDLSLIRHVGPGTAKRLTEAGVTTLTEVAASTAEQLAQASGYSAARIEKENWIGQARRLVRGHGTSGTPADGPGTALVVAPMADPSHRVATFRLELTIQPGGAVHHSDVTYLQDESKHDHWSDWDEQRLAAFVREIAGVAVTPTPAGSTANADATDVEVVEEAPLDAHGARAVAPETFTLELHSDDAPSAGRAVALNGAAEVIVGLPLRGLVTRPTRPVRHRVDVVAVEVGGGERHLVASSATTDNYANGELTLRLPASMPPAGLYRLRADLVVASADAKSKASAAVLRSGPLLVR